MKNHLTKSASERAKYQTAILNKFQVEKFVKTLKSIGAKEELNRPIMKTIKDNDDEIIFCAVKSKSLWDCRIHTLLVNQFVQTCA